MNDQMKGSNCDTSWLLFSPIVFPLPPKHANALAKPPRWHGLHSDARDLVERLLRVPPIQRQDFWGDTTPETNSHFAPENGWLEY